MRYSQITEIKNNERKQRVNNSEIGLFRNHNLSCKRGKVNLMKKPLLILAVAILLATAATMTMAATICEFTFDQSTYDTTTNQYSSLVGTQVLGQSTPAAPSATTWLQDPDTSSNTAFTGSNQGVKWDAAAMYPLRLGGWPSTTPTQMTISYWIKFDALRLSTANQEEPVRLEMREYAEAAASNTTTTVGLNFATPKYTGGGTQTGAHPYNTTQTTLSPSNMQWGGGYYLASTIAEANKKTFAGVKTSDGGIIEPDAHARWMSKYAERGGVSSGPLPVGWVEGDAVPAPIPGDPNAVACSVGNWYLYTVTCDFTNRDAYVYNVYIGTPTTPSVLQATLTQLRTTATTPLPNGYRTLRYLHLGPPGITSSSWNFRGTLDYLKVTDTIDTPAAPAGAVSGTVDLQGWSGAKLGQAVAVTITDASSNSETLNTTLDSNGGYSVTTTLRGTCYVSAKCSHWLSDGKEAVVDANGAAAVDFSMINGDCNNDNGVDEGDFGLLSAAWYSSDGEPSFDARADLNGDGGIDEGDFGLLSAAWYQSGI